MEHSKSSNKPRTLCYLDFFLSQQLETVEYDVSKRILLKISLKHTKLYEMRAATANPPAKVFWVYWMA